jgi:hypothetical protein
MKSTASAALWHRAGSILKIVGLSLLGVQLAYLVVANLLLSTGIIAGLVSRDPKAVTLRYEGAWTVWFGRVHLAKLWLHGSSPTLDWAVETEHASVDVRLDELLRRRFHASRVRGESLVFRIRMRLTPAEAEEPRALALPPIGDGPPLIEAGPPQELDDAHYHLWATRLENVDVGVREIWIQHYRYVGDARTRGSFIMRPQRLVEVPPSVLEVRSGVVTIANHVVSDGIEGRVECTLLPIDPRHVKGVHALEWVDGRVLLDGQIPGLGFVSFYVPPSVELRIDDGSGQARADLALQRGVIGPGSSFAYEFDHLEVASPAFDTTLGGQVTLRTADDPLAPRATLTVHMPHATLERRRLDVPPALVEDATFELEEPTLSLVAIPSQVSGKVSLPAVSIPDLSWINPWMRNKGDAPTFTGGLGFVQAGATMTAEGRASARISVQTKHTALRWRDATLKGDSEGSIRLDAADVLARKVTIGKSHLELRDVVVERKGDASPPWWSTLDVESGELGAGVEGVTVDVRSKDARPAIELLEAGNVLPSWIGKLLRLENLAVRAKIEHKDHRLDFQLFRARAGTLDVRGRLERPDGGRAVGAFLIKSGPLSLGLGITSSGTGLAPFGSDAWLDERMSNLGP